MPMKTPHQKNSDQSSIKSSDARTPQISKNKSDFKKQNRNNGVLTDEEATKVDQDIAEKEMRYPQM